MSKYDGLINEKKEIDMGIRADVEKLQKISNDYGRLAYLAGHAEEVVSDIDTEFAYVTQLNNADIAFLFLAIALQCVRQYFITNFPERVSDKEAAEATGKPEEHSNRGNWLYHPSLEEIQTNPVPFDANNYSNESFKGALKGSKLGHRATAIGHDPILGLVVGTANIATATLTTWDMRSYHIKTEKVIAKTGKNMGYRDVFKYKADTRKVFYYTEDRLFHKGIDGKKAVATALLREVQHLQSDIGSKKSLPFPIVSRFSPELSGKLAEYGIDWGNTVQVGKQGTYAVLFNMLISMLHSLIFYLNEEDDQELFKVRTHKILLYSNAVATSSNILLVAGTEAAAYYTGNAELGKKGLQYLDIGGLAVTLHRLISDENFIRRIKQEFLANRWYETVMNE